MVKVCLKIHICPIIQYGGSRFLQLIGFFLKFSPFPTLKVAIVYETNHEELQCYKMSISKIW
jgi:hypothetical protein